MTQMEELIEAQDLNGLLRFVDASCEARRWDELMEVANGCEEALERGKQLWPISAHIDFRVALEAPGDYAAQVLHPEVGRFALGPLTEVAASSHSWSELAPHLEIPQVAAYVAQERVIRGESLIGDERAHPEILELPLELQTWEPSYRLPVFKSSYVEVPEPWEPRAPLLALGGSPGVPVDDPDLAAALLDLVLPWTAESNGEARSVIVEGDAPAAISCLASGSLRIGRLSLEEALQRMAWAAAGGGARGRRRGGALGRFLAWYTTCLLAGWDWPVEPAVLVQSARGLRFWRWDEGAAAEEGWALRLAVDDLEAGWAAGLVATDHDENGGPHTGRPTNI